MSAFHRDVPAWPAVAVLWVALALFVGQLVGTIVLAAIQVGAGAEEVGPGTRLAQTAITAVVVVGTMLWVASRTARPSAAQFGLRAGRPGRALVGGLAVAGGMAVFMVVWSLLVDVREGLAVPLELDPRTESGRDLDVPLRGAVPVDVGFVVSVLARCVLAAIVSEVVVRGFVFPALSGWRGPLPALVVVAVVFGALGGGSWELAVPAGVLGAALCVLYVWSGTLLGCIAVRAGAAGAVLAAAAGFDAGGMVATAAASSAAALALSVALVGILQHGRLHPAEGGATG